VFFRLWLLTSGVGCVRSRSRRSHRRTLANAQAEAAAVSTSAQIRVLTPRRIEDCFDICKPDYYDAPATPITPFMFESAKVPQSPSHRVSHSRWSSLSSRYSDSSDYHAAENTIREPLRVVVVDSVLNSSGPTSNTPFDSAAPLLTIPGTPLSPMTPLSPVVRTSRHRQSYALETPDTEVGPTQPLRITKRSTLLSPRSPSQPSPFQSPKSLRTQSYRSRWANPAERSPTP